MDRPNSNETKNVIKAINQFAVSTYVQRLLTARYQKLTLFGTFPHTGAVNVSDAHNILKLNEFPSLMTLFGKNCKN